MQLLSQSYEQSDIHIFFYVLIFFFILVFSILLRADFFLFHSVSSVLDVDDNFWNYKPSEPAILSFFRQS